MTNLKPKTSKNAQIAEFDDFSQGCGWHLEIQSGERGFYRLAQLDDYTDLPRRDFTWVPPLILCLSARTSAINLPGTWGFGLWNDPFSLSLGVSGGVRRLPALPNAAWFFHASPENYLSFQKDKPARGFLAQTFHSPSIPTAFLILGTPLIPFLAWSSAARLLRSFLGKIIKDDSALITSDATEWHTYTLQVETSFVLFKVDENLVFQTNLTPAGRLGLVIWIDNQYASFPPSGGLAYGTMENTEPAWIEVKDFEIFGGE